MDVRLHHDTAEFTALTRPLLEADPIRHTVVLTVLALLARVPQSDEGPPVLLSVHRDGFLAQRRCVPRCGICSSAGCLRSVPLRLSRCSHPGTHTYPAPSVRAPRRKRSRSAGRRAPAHRCTSGGRSGRSLCIGSHRQRACRVRHGRPMPATLRCWRSGGRTSPTKRPAASAATGPPCNRLGAVWLRAPWRCCGSSVGSRWPGRQRVPRWPACPGLDRCTHRRSTGAWLRQCGHGGSCRLGTAGAREARGAAHRPGEPDQQRDLSEDRLPSDARCCGDRLHTSYPTLSLPNFTAELWKNTQTALLWRSGETELVRRDSGRTRGRFLRPVPRPRLAW